MKPSARPRSNRTARSRSRDRGSIAILAAVGMAAILGMAAVVIDGGYLAMRRRHMQAAADAAALAGGMALPTSATAISQARAIATQNGFTDAVGGVTVTVNSPYSADTKKIEVIIQTNASTFLGKALRINTGLVKGRAVVTAAPASASIFAGGTSCIGNGCGGTFCLNGSDITIPGSVHSNGQLAVSLGGSTTVGGTVEYNGACAGSAFGTPPATPVATQPYPLSWTMANFPCTFTVPSGNVCDNGPWWVGGVNGCGGGGGTLSSGVICSGSANLQLAGTFINGNVTFAATGTVQLNGQDMSFTANRNNTFIYTSSNASGAVQIGNLRMSWTGDVFAPNGTLVANGQDFTIGGALVASNMQLGPTRWTMTGGGGGGGDPYLSE